MAVLNYSLLIEYDGTDFHGWQSQFQTRTVQDVLQSALAELTGEIIAINGAGRTDAGVHARGQVANMLLETTIPVEKLAPALNSHLPDDVRVRQVNLVDADFHARFTAYQRRYSYTVDFGKPVLGRQYCWALSEQLDVGAMVSCTGMLLGEHDFSGYSKANPEVPNTICTVVDANWEKRESGLIFHIAANRFLHHMVRFLAGTLIEVGRGKFGSVEFRRQLDGDSQALKILRAPAAGLVLEEVLYP